MISVIISSYKNDLFTQLSRNIASNIGVPYEIIKVDNPGIMSIAKAYNIGRKRAKFEVLCFCHEDILFRTKDWGQILVDIFRSKSIGLVGIVGTKAPPLLPVPWWHLDSEMNYSEIFQHYENNQVEKIVWGWKESNSIEEAVVVDGILLCTSKNSNLLFDERFPGFHFYDLALSIDSIKMGYKNLVTNRIVIEHKSNGKLDANWYESLHLFHKLYKPILAKFEVKPINSYAYESWKDVIIKSLHHGKKRISILFWISLLKNKNFLKFNIKYLLTIMFNKV